MLAFWTPNRTVSVALYDLLRRLKSELNALIEELDTVIFTDPFQLWIFYGDSFKLKEGKSKLDVRFFI